MQRLMKLKKACEYLDKSEPNFNKTVRPYITEIKDGRCVKFDKLDLDAWADQNKAANGKPGKLQDERSWQNPPPAFEKKAKSGTLIKQSPAGSFEKALEKRSSTRPSAT